MTYFEFLLGVVKDNSHGYLTELQQGKESKEPLSICETKTFRP